MRVVDDQRGFTLHELLIGTTLTMIIAFAALATLDQVRMMGKRGEQRVDIQQDARDASRTMARELRNVAGSSETADVIERSQPFDLVFKVVDDAPAGANASRLKRVRWCLDHSDSARGRIREQVQTWTTAGVPPVPPAAACPGPGWQSDRVIADRVTNRAAETNRPLWTYRWTHGQVSALSLNLFMDDDVTKPPRESSLRTAVFLRNQNRPPVASFTATPAGVNHVLLNGSGSYDPEGHPLDMVWSANGTKIGEGVNLDWDAKAHGTYTITLRVTDPSGLSASVSQTVVVQ